MSELSQTEKKILRSQLLAAMDEGDLDKAASIRAQLESESKKRKEQEAAKAAKLRRKQRETHLQVWRAPLISAYISSADGSPPIDRSYIAGLTICESLNCIEMALKMSTLVEKVITPTDILNKLIEGEGICSISSADGNFNYVLEITEYFNMRKQKMIYVKDEAGNDLFSGPTSFVAGYYGISVNTLSFRVRMHNYDEEKRTFYYAEGDQPKFFGGDYFVE